MRRRLTSLALLVPAGLLRPEAWGFAVAYWLWLAFDVRRAGTASDHSLHTREDSGWRSPPVAGWQIAWRAEQVVMWGRSVAQPRLTAWYGDPDFTDVQLVDQVSAAVTSMCSAESHAPLSWMFCCVSSWCSVPEPLKVIV